MHPSMSLISLSIRLARVKSFVCPPWIAAGTEHIYVKDDTNLRWAEQHTASVVTAAQISIALKTSAYIGTCNDPVQCQKHKT